MYLHALLRRKLFRESAENGRGAKLQQVGAVRYLWRNTKVKAHHPAGR